MTRLFSPYEFNPLKLDGDWEFLTSLRDTGREATEQWLDAYFDHIGVESTVDLQAVYM